MFAALAGIRKAIASGVGVALTALTFANVIPFIPGSIHSQIGIALAILTPVATWLIPNKAPAA